MAYQHPFNTAHAASGEQQKPAKTSSKAGGTDTRKAWGNMTATERLIAKAGYIEFNYGDRHPLTQAAKQGDLATFRKHAAHITESMDAVVVGIVDAKE